MNWQRMIANVPLRKRDNCFLNEIRHVAAIEKKMIFFEGFRMTKDLGILIVRSGN